MSADCSSSAEHSPAAASSPAAPPARSKPSFGRRRALVLLLVHLAVLAHLLHWKWTGSTLSPLEPSEATDLAEHGRVNAGAIFFALAIGATFVLGRWFCGWACHLVALQDGCRWLLHKLGVRPRPIQLGALALTPLVVCIYMFLGPWLYRLWEGITVTPHVDLFVDSFWATFPGVLMSVVTFLVAGFAIVYFLGAKGFCTYACPYGAIFGIADQFAPQRIRVTDACERCGKCTVACSSNVRVHQEVHDFGAVIDPGCMKCLDCVSACPKDALYVGFGAPALWTSRRSDAGKGKGFSWPRFALSALFVFGLFVVLLAHQSLLDLRAQLGFVASMAAGSVLIAWLFRGKSTRVGGPGLAEEALLAASFLGAVFVLRGYRPFESLAPTLVARAPWTGVLGLHEGVPLLLSLSLAGLIAYGVLLSARLLSRSEVALQAVALRRGGRLTRAGAAFVAAMVVVVGVTGHAAHARRERGLERERATQERTAAEAAFARGVAGMEAQDLESARNAFEEVLRLSPGRQDARTRLAGVDFMLGRDADAAALLDEVLRANPQDVDALFLRGLLAIRRGDRAAAERDWTSLIGVAPEHAAAREALATLCEERGDFEGAARHRARIRTPQVDGTSGG